MFNYTRSEDVYSGSVIVHWLGITFFSGFMNAVAFVGLGMFATHVTGFVTLLGVHMASAHWRQAVTALFVPVFFLLGAVVSGLWIEARLRNSKRPRYDWVMYFCTALLLLTIYTSDFKMVQVDFIHFDLSHNFMPLSAISMASGLMNAALSHASHSTMRIAHLTGITTDLGRGIAELITGQFRSLAEKEQILRLSWLKGLTISFFIFGSLFGTLLFQKLAFTALILPAIYFLYAGVLARKCETSGNS